MNITEEFGEHTCEVCGTDCAMVEERIDEMTAKIAQQDAEIERLKTTLNEDQYIAEANLYLHEKLNASEATVETLKGLLREWRVKHEEWTNPPEQTLPKMWAINLRKRTDQELGVSDDKSANQRG